MKTLTQIELDQILARGCQTPGCDHKEHQNELYLHANCHVDSPPWAKYEKGGTIRLECSACGKPVVQIAVAQR